MIVTMLGVTWKIRSWKTGKVPFKMPLVYKSQAYNRVASTMRLIDGSGWLGQTAINSIFANDTALMKLSEFSMRFNVLNNNNSNPAPKK